MRILIIGTGALGGYFGARLLAAGRDVTFLVRPARIPQLATSGLNLTSPHGDLHIPTPPTITADTLASTYDLILLSCKAHDLTSSMDSFAAAVGTTTAILPLLNGMAHMDALDARFGRQHVLGGATDISAVRDPDGLIRHLNTLDHLLFGDRDDPSGPRITAIAAALTVPGFGASLRPVILQDMGEKWVAISTGAGMTCLMRATIGDIVAAGAAPLVNQLMLEAASIVASTGYQPTQDFLAVTLAKFTQPGSLFTASMLRDLESGAPIEARQIIGDLLTHGRTANLPTPLLEVVNAHLRCHEIRQQREATNP
ncbi:ketopantoate reductase family protein [Granulicella tundricola]|uniref:2-dehydropantoate 2-reductase n=1 Tax=Granulicella tundricola (strain ATCC BAA-1859 / DSM 23138 / MP5ACTX9) TaxID=1198114 RepID=E8WVT5_GRATM|nr:ketopantoate reductase family protein [Granulicella tundricola]ADW70694.1 2-dehydropantoate 2-reductase [Granulicella tundricola MP5ACTX9]